ncbi:hypothetical protein NAT51_04115 [Flavobacterium amniphilum]|uniref:hypothetical protein n=1 Tax=Flavobacterium amniphilum TaxID=1834035 RepID=UPI002029E0F8|nr:hypothetical protein [Flavobacterium amniphilum]MCL9804693.1 hypothetical protein [Flavobacterium amniphilum]
MKKALLPFFACFLLLAFCKNEVAETNSDFYPETFRYQQTTAPVFFRKLIQNHLKDFYAVDHDDYEDAVTKHLIKKEDSVNDSTFYTLQILHKLFTSHSASNYSKGDILNIPYFWHWTNPNPRYGILDLETNAKLTGKTPPKEFSKYKSFADIDRTPYLFLSDLVSDKPKYNTPQCGNFNTFGWCSEREMAFVALLTTMGYEGKVTTRGNHSWSEFIVPLQNNQNTKVFFKVTIDNTFDKMELEPIATTAIPAWKKEKNDGLGDWYNQKAHAETELKRIRSLGISPVAAGEIEKKVVEYLNRQK